MAIIQDWKFRSRSHQCCFSGEPFADGDEFYTCIFVDPESDGYIRRDYSARSWKLIRKNLDPPPFSFWKSTYEAPQPEPKGEALEAHSAEATLRRLIDEGDPATENARYILALMLERKKTLRPVDEKDSDTDGRRLIFYEHKESGEVFIVIDPGLKLADIEAIQTDVISLLGSRMAEASVMAPGEETAPEDGETPPSGDTGSAAPQPGGDAPAEGCSHETLPEPSAAAAPSGSVAATDC